MFVGPGGVRPKPRRMALGGFPGALEPLGPGQKNLKTHTFCRPFWGPTEVPRGPPGGLRYPRGPVPKIKKHIIVAGRFYADQHMRASGAQSSGHGPRPLDRASLPGAGRSHLQAARRGQPALARGCRSPAGTGYTLIASWDPADLRTCAGPLHASGLVPAWIFGPTPAPSPSGFRAGYCTTTLRGIP